MADEVVFKCAKCGDERAKEQIERFDIPITLACRHHHYEQISGPIVDPFTFLMTRDRPPEPQVTVLLGSRYHVGADLMFPKPMLKGQPESPMPGTFDCPQCGAVGATDDGCNMCGAGPNG